MKKFLEAMYSSLYSMPPEKRNKILFEIFGWDGQDAYLFLSEKRLEDDV